MLTLATDSDQFNYFSRMNFLKAFFIHIQMHVTHYDASIAITML